MKLSEAIKQADDLRPNAFDAAQKAIWCYEIEGAVAEMMGINAPENLYPQDAPLLMPRPYESIYALYIAAKIDYYNEETALYQNDLAVFEEAFSRAQAWWIRTHKPAKSMNWKVMR